MSQFLTTALGYPTLIYSILLAVCVVYWLLAATGLVDLDALDALDAVDTGDVGDAGGLAGLLARMGLDRIPFMLVVTLVAFFAWFATYFVHLLLLSGLYGWLRWLLGSVAAAAALPLGAVATTLVLRPFRRWLLRLRPVEPPSLLGRVAVVRTAAVSQDAGTADLDDGGAGLILQVRSDAQPPPARGDRVVLVAFDPPSHTYQVVHEDDYRHI